MNRKELLAWIDTVPEDEPIFCLRAKDNGSLVTIESWLDEAEQLGCAPAKIRGVDVIWRQFFHWRYSNQDKCKVPD